MLCKFSTFRDNFLSKCFEQFLFENSQVQSGELIVHEHRPTSQLLTFDFRDFDFVTFAREEYIISLSKVLKQIFQLFGVTMHFIGGPRFGHVLHGASSSSHWAILPLLALKWAL